MKRFLIGTSELILSKFQTSKSDCGDDTQINYVFGEPAR